jgi:hypothetical protein
MHWKKQVKNQNNKFKKIILIIALFNLKVFNLFAQDTCINYYLDKNLTNEIESVIANIKNSYVGSVAYIKIEYKGDNKIIEINYAKKENPVYQLIQLTNRFLCLNNENVPIVFDIDFRLAIINGYDFRNSNQSGGGYVIIVNSENKIILSGGQN